MNQIRKQEIKSIYNCLDIKNKYIRLNIAVKIENSIQDYIIDKAHERNIPDNWNDKDFINLYHNISYTIKINIDPFSSVNKSNRYLLNKIIRSYFISNLSVKDILFKYGDFLNIKNIGSMTALELNPHINMHYIMEIEHRNKQEIKVKFSVMYKCNKCGEKKTSFKEVQTRSMDEGGTIIVTCLNCGNEWKIY